MNNARPKTAKVMRIHPEGATLARATGAPLVVGDALSDGETVTLATPTGSGGALTLDASLSVTVRMVRAPAAAPAVAAPSTAHTEPAVKPVVTPIFESGFRSVASDDGSIHVGSIGARRIGESDEGVPK